MPFFHVIEANRRQLRSHRFTATAQSPVPAAESGLENAAPGPATQRIPHFWEWNSAPQWTQFGAAFTHFNINWWDNYWKTEGSLPFLALSLACRLCAGPCLLSSLPCLLSMALRLLLPRNLNFRTPATCQKTHRKAWRVLWLNFRIMTCAVSLHPSPKTCRYSRQQIFTVCHRAVTP